MNDGITLFYLNKHCFQVNVKNSIRKFSDCNVMLSKCSKSLLFCLGAIMSKLTLSFLLVLVTTTILGIPSFSSKRFC